MTPQYTCISCRVGFREANMQRDHYKTDWHRYNLKRKVAELEPVTAEEFQKKVCHQQAIDADNAKPTIEHCKPCSKSFNTKNAYVNHLNSKKHKICEEKYNMTASNDDSEKAVGDDFVVVDHKMLKDQSVLPTAAIVESESDFEEVDSDEWEDYDEENIEETSLLKPSDCLFCEHKSQNMVKNLTHMTVAHSFFIPDVEYCTDIKGLLNYLGVKVSRGYICLWCNDHGKVFRSQEAAQAHMRDKGHCKVLHEGTSLAEYTDFYDYSSSYPDYENDNENMEVDDEEVILQPTTIDDEEFQLVLPSGSVIGHRSLFRYYKQNLSSHNTEVVVHKKDDKLRRVLKQYRMLGYAPQQLEATARKARDIHYMKRVQAKWSSQLGIKANKLQTHFRAQINF